MDKNDLFSSCSEEEAQRRMLQAIPMRLIERWAKEADKKAEEEISKMSLHEMITSFSFYLRTPISNFESAKSIGSIEEEDTYDVGDLLKVVKKVVLSQVQPGYRVRYVEEKISELLKVAEPKENVDVPY